MCPNAFKRHDAVKVNPNTAGYREGFTIGIVKSISPNGIVYVQRLGNPRRVRPFYRGHLERVEIRKGGNSMIITNAQHALDKAIIALVAIRNAPFKGRVHLCENSDSALVVKDIVKDVATAMDALGYELATCVGIDGLNPCFVDALDGSDYECACEEAAHERDEPPIDLRDAFGTLNRRQQGV